MGKPIRCEAEYMVRTDERENGVFKVGGKDIKGYCIWENKDYAVLIWNLPDSIKDVISTLEKSSWLDSEINYDDLEGLEDSEGSGSSYYDENDNELEGTPDFEGEGDTELVSFRSPFGFSSISIIFEDKNENLSAEYENDGIILKLPDGSSLSFSDEKKFTDELIKRLS